MPRYYFHVRSSNGREIEGICFDTLDEAVADARRARGGAPIDDSPRRGSQLDQRVQDDRMGTGACATLPFFDS
jgi:hypothetical protein